MKQTINEYMDKHKRYITVDTSDDYNDSHDVVAMFKYSDVKELIELALKAQRNSSDKILSEWYEDQYGFTEDGISPRTPIITEIEVAE